MLRRPHLSTPHLSVSVPVIKVPPQSQLNGSGGSLLFFCEVFAFPMALVEWRKDGRDVVLPGDDPHISVQVGSHLQLCLLTQPTHHDNNPALISSFPSRGAVL